MGETKVDEARLNETKPKEMVRRRVAIALGIICILLITGLGGAMAYYVSMHHHTDSDYDSLTSQNTNLQNQNNQLQAWLDGNETLLNQTETWLDGNITYYNSQISSLDSQIANLQNQKNQLQTSLNGNITNYETRISSLNTQINQLQTWLNGNITSYTSQINSLNSQITNLQSQINNLNSNIANLEDLMNQLQNQYPWVYDSIMNITLPQPEMPFIHLYGTASGGSFVGGYSPVYNEIYYDMGVSNPSSFTAYNVTLYVQLSFNGAGYPDSQLLTYGTLESGHFNAINNANPNTGMYNSGGACTVVSYMGVLSNYTSEIIWQNNVGAYFHFYFDIESGTPTYWQ